MKPIADENLLSPSVKAEYVLIRPVKPLKLTSYFSSLFNLNLSLLLPGRIISGKPALE